MPNHCENDLYIYGPVKERIKLARHVAGLPPLPEPQQVTIESDADEDQILSSFRVAKGVTDRLPREPIELEDAEEIFDFNTIIAYPKHYKKLDEEAHEIREKMSKMQEEERVIYIEEHGFPTDGFNSGGYEWCRQHWGTKWNAYMIDRQVRKTSLFYTFQTAWTPPVPVILELARMFPKLKMKLKYFERGCAYQGILELEGKIILKNEQNKYHGIRGG